MPTACVRSGVPGVPQYALRSAQPQTICDQPIQRRRVFLVQNVRYSEIRYCVHTAVVSAFYLYDSTTCNTTSTNLIQKCKFRLQPLPTSSDLHNSPPTTPNNDTHKSLPHQREETYRRITRAHRHPRPPPPFWPRTWRPTQRAHAAPQPGACRTSCRR